jgi:hypothetical protein
MIAPSGIMEITLSHALGRLGWTLPATVTGGATRSMIGWALCWATMDVRKVAYVLVPKGQLMMVPCFPRSTN